MAASSMCYLMAYGMMASRILYNLPVEALAALGISSIVENKGVKGEVKASLLLFIMAFSATYLLHSLANLL